MKLGNMQTIFISMILLITTAHLKAPENVESCPEKEIRMEFFPQLSAVLNKQLNPEYKEIDDLVTKGPQIEQQIYFRNKWWSIHSLEKDNNQAIISLAPINKESNYLKIIHSPTKFEVKEITPPQKPATWQQTYYPWLRAAALAVGLASLIKLYYSFQEAPE